MRAVIESLKQNRAVIVRILIGLQVAHYFACWLFQIPQVHAIFNSMQPVPAWTLYAISICGFAASVSFAFGRFTKPSAGLMILTAQALFLFYFWFKEIQWYFAGILLMHILYGTRDGRFSTIYWRQPFFLAIYAGFTISGLSKLFYPGWWSGEVLYTLLTHHVVGPGWPTDFVQAMPYRALAYVALSVEILSFPLALWSRTRRVAWWLNTLFHFGIFAWWRIWPVALGTLTTQILLYPGRDRDLLSKEFNSRDSDQASVPSRSSIQSLGEST